MGEFGRDDGPRRGADGCMVAAAVALVIGTGLAALTLAGVVAAFVLYGTYAGCGPPQPAAPKVAPPEVAPPEEVK